MLNEHQLSFSDAETFCRRTVSTDSRLVQISSYNELSYVQRMCRGDAVPTSAANANVPESPARRGGCWIGLQMSAATQEFEWLTQEFTTQTVSKTVFRNWRRAEPNNHTFSEGQSTSGELCTILVPWQEDPLIVEEGSWNDVACNLLKPAVCQASFATVRYTLTVSAGTTAIRNGAFEGGYLTLKGQSLIGSFSLFRSATLLLAAPSYLFADIPLHDGSHLIVNTTARVRHAVLIGELDYSRLPQHHAPSSESLAVLSDQLQFWNISTNAFVPTNSSAAALARGASLNMFVSKGILPKVTVVKNGGITFDSTCASSSFSTASSSITMAACSSMFNATINAAVSLRGSLTVQQYVNVFVAQVR
jgi:hypothetical protein